MPDAKLLLFLAVAAASACCVGVVRRVAIAQGIIDHPTHRGSHAQPTPRGGGLGAMVALVAALLWIGPAGNPIRLAVGVVACAAVAFVGWLDDRGGLPVRTRLGVHVVAGLSVGALSLQNAPSPWSFTALVLFACWTFWTVSSINVVNFMDGINGLIGSQIAIFAGSIVFFHCTAVVSWYALAVAAACIGFLPWNYPRARIFLGDVGSGALGFLVAFIGLAVVRDGCADVFQAYLPLLALFGDATATLVRRWRRGEKLTQAHRSHLYQRMANGGVGHTRVTLLYAAAALVGAAIAHISDRATSIRLAALYAIVLVALALFIERRLATMPARAQ